MNRLTFRNSIRLLLIVILFLGTLTITSLGGIMSIASGAQANKPTIVFVHGAFAESSSWNGVLTKLIPKGYPTVAVANPLRGVIAVAKFIRT